MFLVASLRYVCAEWRKLSERYKRWVFEAIIRSTPTRRSSRHLTNPPCFGYLPNDENPISEDLTI